MEAVILSTGEGTPANTLTDPAFWMNASAIGIIAGAFMAGKLHSTGEMDRVTKAYDAALTAQKEAHLDTVQRTDDQIRQLMLERDRSNAERDEAIGVMRDFTMMAGAIFNQNQPWRPSRRSGPKAVPDND